MCGIGRCPSPYAYSCGGPCELPVACDAHLKMKPKFFRALVIYVSTSSQMGLVQCNHDGANITYNNDGTLTALMKTVWKYYCE